MKWFCLKLFVDDISGRSLNFLNDIRGLFFELIFGIFSFINAYIAFIITYFVKCN